MELVYLGFFSRVFEWVLNHIFEPVFRFVANLLNTAITWIFQEVLAPLLMPVLEDVLEFAIKLWVEIYSTQLYLCFSGVLKLIDYLETAFDVFIGLRDVSFKSGGTEITGTLIEVLMQQKNISRIFWILTIGGLGIAMMLTIFATAKSALDFDFDNKRPVTKVMAAMMKAFIQFFTVPFLVYFMLKLSAVILKGVTSALTASGNTSLGRMLFVIASLDAAKAENFNVSSNSGVDIGPFDDIRKPFYVIGERGVSSKDYGKLSEVDNYFHLAEFDYLIGFIAAVFLLFTIGICLVIFIQRIFELLILYLVSPYFVCTMPLDDGEKFSRWRELFIGKCFSGFGSAIGMRLYLLVCPAIMGNQIRLAANSSPETEYMMKLFFLAGGAWAVYKSGSMVTSLISSQAGQSEMQTANMAGGMLYGHTIGMAINKGKGAMMSMGSRLGTGMGRRGGAGMGGAGKGGLGLGSKGAEASQAFQGGKKKKWEWNGAKVNSLNSKAQKLKDKKSAERASALADKKAADKAARKEKVNAALREANAAKKAKAAAKAGLDGKGKLKAKTGIEVPKVSGLDTGKKEAGLEDKKNGAFEGDGLKAKDDLKIDIGGLKKEEANQAFTDAPAEAGEAVNKENALPAEGGPEAAEEEKKQSFGHSFSIGSFLSRQYDEEGNMKFRIMGMGYSTNADGNTTSLTLPGLKLKKATDGHYMVRRFSAVPGVSIARTETDKGIKFSDLSLFGMGYHMREEGKQYNFGKSFVVQKGSDGSSHYKIGLGARTKDEDGNVRYQFGRLAAQKDADGSRQYQLGGKSYTKVVDKEDGVDKIVTSPINLHMTAPKEGEKSQVQSVRIGKVNYARVKRPDNPDAGKGPEAAK